MGDRVRMGSTGQDINGQLPGAVGTMDEGGLDIRRFAGAGNERHAAGDAFGQFGTQQKKHSRNIDIDRTGRHAGSAQGFAEGQEPEENGVVLEAEFRAFRQPAVALGRASAKTLLQIGQGPLQHRIVDRRFGFGFVIRRMQGAPFVE